MSTTATGIELDHSVEIYVPTQCRCGQPLPEDVRAEVLEEVKAALYDWFGGVSKQSNVRVDKVEGSWPLDSGDMADEEVDVVFSNASAEALEEHFEELPAFAADLANRLTQEAVAFRVDGKMTLMPGEDTKPHRCAGGASPGSLPVGRQPDEKERMRALQASLQRIASLNDVRDLFCNILHYEFENEQLATVGWPDKLKECLAPGTAPQIIADQNGFKILYLQLAEDYLRKGHERLVIQRLIKDDPTLRGLFVISDVDQKDWHLVNAKFETQEGSADRLLLRRMRVGSGQSVRTAVERLSDIDVEKAGEEATAAELQDLHDRAFDVESVSKAFFEEISNWYFWALSEVEFPTDTVRDGDDEKHRATSLIRFLTRIIFCWFLKEKRLVPDSLFSEKDLADILVDLDEDSCTYHQGILQNLFFATLNQRMGKDSKGQPWRAFAKDEGFAKNRSTYGVDTLYRYEEHFRDEATALSHFAEVPFLNGGLFECLDRTDEDTGRKLYVDGFSRNRKKRPKVPNRLFFSETKTVDLSDAYGDNGRRNSKVRGLLRILHAYNFTVEENTPIDEEIALDPELLGKVFENLLASYNEETKTTARKQTGSFYTPRPIVEYMVDESLKAHLSGTLVELGRPEEQAREQLDLLLGYTDEEPTFSEEEVDALLEAIHTCKILDPACGSGAFPIGMLQKLVHVVHQLDPENARWKQLQIDQAGKIPDSSARDAAIKAIEKDFEENGDDYGRKLYLIENCLYGVDIQPIAIQISKLRFFISLICDQTTNRDKAKNHGIRALPNLETKFVAADTLVGLPEMDQMALLDPRVNQIEAEIESLYHRHFSIQRRDQKLALQRRLKELRQELGKVLSESLGTSQKAQHLAEWDPFDSQASAEFFDPHWMFGKGLVDGFDLVIGNPPYIQIQTFPAAQKELWKTLRFNTYAATADIYCLFYERGQQLLRPGGHLCYISSNKWMRSVYGEKLRGFLNGSCNLHLLVDFGGVLVFNAATVDTNICLFSRSENTGEFLSAYIARDFTFDQQLSDYVISRSVAYLPPSEPSRTWAIISDQRKVIRELVIAQSSRLSSFDVTINYGIKTGCNEAFIIDTQQRNRIISEDADASKIIVPLLRGRNLKPYLEEWKEEWLINCHNGVKPAGIPPVEARDYPGVYSHLEGFRDRLERRGDKGDDWYNLRNCAYLLDFEKPKIIYPEITKWMPFVYDRTIHYYPNNKGFILTSDKLSLAYLTALFNSSLFRCCYRDEFPTQGDDRRELRKVFFEALHIRAIGDHEKPQFEPLVLLVQLAKRAGDSSLASFLEDIVDACIMECYFREHMAERDLLFLDDLASHLEGFDPDASETKQRDFLDHFHRTLTAKGSKTRDRLDRICTDSPDLLAVIKGEGKV